MADVRYDADAQASLVPKHETPAGAVKLLEAVLETVDEQAAFNAPTLGAMLCALCTILGAKSKELFMPTRMAVAGRKATPPLLNTMHVLGKKRCRRHSRNATELLSAQLA